MEDFDEPPSQNKCSTIILFLWKVFTCLFTHVILVTMVIAYCLLGAFTFQSLESQHEKDVKVGIRHSRENVTEQLWIKTTEFPVLYPDNWTRDAMVILKEFETRLVKAMKTQGWDGSEDTSDEAIQWTFSGALFYSIIVITTIGYGHIAPKTDEGKIVTIFYAIVGIPLMLLCLSNIGDIMAHSFRFLYWKICCYACTREPKRRNSTQRRSRSRGRSGARSRTASFTYGIQQPPPIDGAVFEDRGNAPGAVPDVDPRQFGHPKDIGPGSGRRYLRQGSTSATELREAIPHEIGRAGSFDKDNTRTPVLCNKYAFDVEGYYNDPRHMELGGKLPSTGKLNADFMGSRRSQGTASKYSNYSYSDYSDDMSTSNEIKPVPIWLCVFLVVSYIIGGAFLFSGWEGWNFPDSAYFCFITLTTIGFGDFVPAQKREGGGDEWSGRVSIALCSLYLLFGIALLAMSFNLVQEEVISNVKAVARHLGIIKDETNEMDDNYD